MRTVWAQTLRETYHNHCVIHEHKEDDDSHPCSFGQQFSYEAQVMIVCELRLWHDVHLRWWDVSHTHVSWNTQNTRNNREKDETLYVLYTLCSWRTVHSVTPKRKRRDDDFCLRAVLFPLQSLGSSFLSSILDYLAWYLWVTITSILWCHLRKVLWMHSLLCWAYFDTSSSKTNDIPDAKNSQLQKSSVMENVICFCFVVKLIPAFWLATVFNLMLHTYDLFCYSTKPLISVHRL